MPTPTKANLDRIASEARMAYLNATKNPTLPKSWHVVEIRWPKRGPVTHGGKSWSSASAALRLSARLAYKAEQIAKVA